MCAAVLFGWDPATPPPPHLFWAHIRGRYWSAKIDDISLWRPAATQHLPPSPSTCSLILSYWNSHEKSYPRENITVCWIKWYTLKCHVCNGGQYCSLDQSLWLVIESANTFYTYRNVHIWVEMKHWNGLVKYIDTKAKCRHLQKFTCKGILRKVFFSVYTVDCWYFRPSFVNYCPSNPSLWEKVTEYMYTVCKGGGGFMVLGLR